MFKKKECVAMLLAGGQGSRLYALTQKVAKPAVPFGGKYRIIDFPLSNCTNSGIDTVGVLTQYQPLVLNDYIGIRDSTRPTGTRELQMQYIRICSLLTGTARSMCLCFPATTYTKWIIPK